MIRVSKWKHKSGDVNKFLMVYHSLNTRKIKFGIFWWMVVSTRILTIIIFFAEKEPGKKRFGIKYDSYFMAYYFIILIESLNVL